MWHQNASKHIFGHTLQYTLLCKLSKIITFSVPEFYKILALENAGRKCFFVYFQHTFVGDFRNPSKINLNYNNFKEKKTENFNEYRKQADELKQKQKKK